MLTSRCAALVVVMPQMTHSCLSRGAESDPASEAEYSGVAVPDAESSCGLSSPPFFLFSISAAHLIALAIAKPSGRLKGDEVLGPGQHDV